MYLVYSIEDYDDIPFIDPIGILKSEEDMKKFKEMSSSTYNIEEVPVIDIEEVKPIYYMDFEYQKDGSHTYSIKRTNTFLTRNIDQYNNAYILDGNVKITKVIDGKETAKNILEKLLKIAPKILLDKELNDLDNSENNGVRTNSLYVKIQVSDLLKLIQEEK